MRASKRLRLAAVAGGGALGGALRFGIEEAFPTREIPWGTLTANMMGCVLVAAVIVLLEETRRAAQAGQLPADVDVDVDVELEEQVDPESGKGAVAAPLLLGERSTLLRLLLATGIGGGLTTFSSFAVEIVDLIEEGAARAAVSYAAITLTMGVALAAVTAGLARRWVLRFFKRRSP